MPRNSDLASWGVSPTNAFMTPAMATTTMAMPSRAGITMPQRTFLSSTPASENLPVTTRFTALTTWLAELMSGS